MKSTLVYVFTILFCGGQYVHKTTEIMNNSRIIEETISKLFVYTDSQNWSGVEAQFAQNVSLDYESMTGNPAAKLTPSNITAGWKTVLPGFTYTHHQIGNFIVEEKNDQAHVFCYGTATHFLENDNGNTWTVTGSYDFDLVKIDNKWKITSMKFNYKFQEGNTALVQAAIDNLK